MKLSNTSLKNLQGVLPQLADGYSHAVDLYPLDWNTPAKFDAVAKAMFTAADRLGYVIRWGADWDRDSLGGCAGLWRR